MNNENAASRQPPEREPRAAPPATSARATPRGSRRRQQERTTAMKSNYTTEWSRNRRPQHRRRRVSTATLPGRKKRATTDPPIDFIPSVRGHTRQRRRDREQRSREITNRDAAKHRPTPGAEATTERTPGTSEPITRIETARSRSVTKKGRRKRFCTAHPDSPTYENEKAERRRATNVTEGGAQYETCQRRHRSDRKQHHAPATSERPAKPEPTNESGIGTAFGLRHRTRRGLLGERRSPVAARLNRQSQRLLE